MLQQSLSSILNEYLPEWSIEFFRRDLGISKANEKYLPQIIIEDHKGSSGKSTIRRILRIVLGVRNYVSLDRNKKDKEFLKLQRQGLENPGQKSERRNLGVY